MRNSLSNLRATARNHTSQAGWSLLARGIAAGAQMLTIVILARNLPPDEFAHAVVIQTVLTVVATINGLGLIRRLQYVRSRDPHNTEQPGIASLRLLYTHASVVVWVLGVGLAAIFMGSTSPLVLMPAAVWLLCEQVTQVWNAISITDGKTVHLVASYSARRFPVVMVLIVAASRGWDMNLGLTTGMALGGLVSLGAGVWNAPEWARTLLVNRSSIRSLKIKSDVGTWLTQLGDQVRELETPALTALAPVTAGLYALPARLVRPMSMISMAVSTTLYPTFARKSEIQVRQLAKAIVLGSLPTALVTAIVAAAAPMLPTIVGDQFSESIVALQVMCATTVLWAPSMILVSFLQSRSATTGPRFGVLLIGSNFIYVAAVAVAGTMYGPLAAATASVVVQALTLAILLATALKVVRHHPDAVLPGTHQGHV